MRLSVVSELLKFYLSIASLKTVYLKTPKIRVSRLFLDSQYLPSLCWKEGEKWLPTTRDEFRRARLVLETRPQDVHWLFCAPTEDAYSIANPPASRPENKWANAQRVDLLVWTVRVTATMIAHAQSLLNNADERFMFLTAADGVTIEPAQQTVSSRADATKVTNELDAGEVILKDENYDDDVPVPADAQCSREDCPLASAGSGLGNPLLICSVESCAHYIHGGCGAKISGRVFCLTCWSLMDPQSTVDTASTSSVRQAVFTTSEADGDADAVDPAQLHASAVSQWKPTPWRGGAFRGNPTPRPKLTVEALKLHAQGEANQVRLDGLSNM